MGRRVALLLWIVALTTSVWLVVQLHVDTDMTAFLPKAASTAQRVLVDQFRDGVVSRMVLLAIEGVPVEEAAIISKRLEERLRADQSFVTVQNGEASGFEQDRKFLWSNRYLLSDQVKPDRFTIPGLRRELEADLADLGSSAGFLLKHTLEADPTNEMLHLIEQQRGEADGPAREDGVWVSPDQKRALLLVRLRAIGSDIDGARQALVAIHSAFHDLTSGPQGGLARLLMTGPPVFAVEAQARIKSDATMLSLMASLLVASALLAVYRSPRVVVLAFVPVTSGGLIGVAVVGLVFHTIHGITLGFGATLIGEAVDYAVYLFTQTTLDSPIERTLQRIWPTIRLGALTSICGFSAMLMSSFEGFAQLGLFTITGLAVAVCVTRWVLPALIPSQFAGARQSRTMMRIASVAMKGTRLRLGVLGLALIAVTSLFTDNSSFWADNLSSLSPVSADQQRLDQSLRQDMQAPDAGFLVVVRQTDQEAALQSSENLASSLSSLVGQGAIDGFDSPSRYLPSIETQRSRQAALPDTKTLQSSLDAALEDLPFQSGLFDPFVSAVGRARLGPLITRADLDGTSLALKLDSLLIQRQGQWLTMLSLHNVKSPAAVTNAIKIEPNAVLVDLKSESNRLLKTYLRQGATLAGLGAIGITMLLAVSLRSVGRVAMVMAPLAAAVVVTLALLRLGGHALSIFNLFGMLLVVAIGSNYCLFFDRRRSDVGNLTRVLASLMLANACTVAGFGVLALSQTPVLHDLGLPVAIGTFLSLVFAIIIMSPSHDSGSFHADA